MTKAELVASLDGIKNMTSVVSIESMLEMLEAMEPEVVEASVAPAALPQELIEEILNRIERRLENESTSLVDMDSIELSLDYDNQIRIDSAGIDVYEVMREIQSVLDNISEDRDRAAEALSDEEDIYSHDDMTFAREEDDTLNEVRPPSSPEALNGQVFIETCDDAGEKLIVRFEDYDGGLGGPMDNEMS